jgi:hypothetical protein
VDEDARRCTSDNAFEIGPANETDKPVQLLD